MPWIIERRHDHVALVTMNTNKVNAQNPAFFADLHAAFDRLEAEFDDCAVVLTGTGKAFSAGLDLDHHFAMYARRNLREIDNWFAAYRATNLRLFTYPRPTVAAINGHVYAGGFITAIDCDYRIATEGALQFALNEVPIGIPMPAVYCEIIKYAIGTKAASEFTLFGQVYDLDAASRMGVVQKTVALDQLLDAAVAWAALVPPRLLSGLCLFEACPTGNDDGRNRFSGAARSGLAVARHVGSQKSARECSSLPRAEGPGYHLGAARLSLC